MISIRNLTALDTAWLEQLVELVKPEGLAGEYTIYFAPDDLPHGLADPHLRLVRVYLGGEQHLQRGLAFTWRNRITCHTMAETAVYLVAHELRHLWQWENGGVPKERDADAYAARALRRARRGLELRGDLAHTCPVPRPGAAQAAAAAAGATSTDAAAEALEP